LLEVTMTTTDATMHGTYRCPVCGHRDSIEVVPGEPAKRIACSYCGVSLDVSARSAGAVNLDVKVAEQAVRG
jgi:transcription elongation factor Elf1